MTNYRLYVKDLVEEIFTEDTFDSFSNDVASEFFSRWAHKVLEIPIRSKEVVNIIKTDISLNFVMHYEYKQFMCKRVWLGFYSDKDAILDSNRSIKDLEEVVHKSCHSSYNYTEVIKHLAKLQEAFEKMIASQNSIDKYYSEIVKSFSIISRETVKMFLLRLEEVLRIAFDRNIVVNKMIEKAYEAALEVSPFEMRTHSLKGIRRKDRFVSKDAVLEELEADYKKLISEDLLQFPKYISLKDLVKDNMQSHSSSAPDLKIPQATKVEMRFKDKFS